MVEYVANKLYAAIPQQNLHSNTPGTQESPVIARLADGGFVAGWISGSDFFVQRYDSQGLKAGGEQLIASGVYDPALVGLSGGGFAAAWTANGIYARTFDASGNAASNVFTASTSSPSAQMQQPALGADANNGLVIAWTDSSGDGLNKIKARAFDALGAGRTGEILVAATPSLNNYNPQVSVQADGDFLVSWTGPFTASSGENFWTAANARLFNAAGIAKSDVVSSHEFQSVPGFHDGFFQSITTLTSGGFVMTWTDSTANGTTIRGQRYDADGARIGAQFQVNPPDGLEAGQSTVTALDTGGFIVTWRVETDDGGPNYFQRGNIMAQAFDADGVTVGDAYLVNDTVPLGQDLPAVTAFGSGDIAVLWRTWTDAGNSDVAIKLFYSTIIGTANDDTLTGTSDTDYLVGLAGNDTIFAGDGNDSVDGGAGNDGLYGGAGDDTYSVESQGDIVFENAGEGNDTVIASAGYYLYANIENLTLEGATGADDFFGVGNDLDNTITGNSGSNLLIGGAGNDQINGGAGVDSLFGETGNDTLRGGDGVDYLVGGAGDDVLDGEAGPDALYGEDGNDTLTGGITFDTDILVGGNGNDLLDGASGLGDYDLMDGGAGNDTYLVDTPDDLTFEALNDGTDTVRANINGAGYYLYANTENLILEGATPFGVGNELNNQLTGNDVSNYLLGGLGNDVLNGKGDNDVLFGEGGADTFVFERGTGGDVIGDFQAGVDKISLIGLGFANYAALQPNIFQVGGNTGINLGQGDFIVINGVTNAQLSATDFLFG